jgi:hypothetical protein
VIELMAWVIFGFRARSGTHGRRLKTAAWANEAWWLADDGRARRAVAAGSNDPGLRELIACQPTRPLCCAQSEATAAHRHVRTVAPKQASLVGTIFTTAKWTGTRLALLLVACRGLAMRGSLMYAPLLGYWILVVVVSVDLRAQWTLAVFGPPLVLMAWLDALSRRREWLLSDSAGVRKLGELLDNPVKR